MTSPRQTLLTIALAQIRSEPGAVARNLAQAKDAIREARTLSADLVVFPELYLQGYRADDAFAALAEPIDGPSVRSLAALAAEIEVHVVFGMARREPTRKLSFNSACMVGPSGLVGVYDKVHLPAFSGIDETRYFAPGGSLLTVDTPFGRTGIQICYDASFPEVTRSFALDGATLNVVLSAAPVQFEATWPPMLHVRSRENGIPTLFCNSVGNQRDSAFFGGSAIVDSMGQVVAKGGDRDELVIAQLDQGDVARVRSAWPRLRDRRPDLYGAVCSPYDERVLSCTVQPDADLGGSAG